MAAGALIRTSFVARHRALVLGKRVPWEYAVAGCVLLVGLGVWQAPGPRAAPAADYAAAAPTFAQVQAIVEERCSLCHNAQLANKGVRLDAPDQILAHAAQMYQQAVVLKAMPLNNATQITDAERAVLRRWSRRVPTARTERGLASPRIAPGTSAGAGIAASRFEARPDPDPRPTIEVRPVLRPRSTLSHRSMRRRTAERPDPSGRCRAEWSRAA